MADQKLSALTEITGELKTTDELYINESGTSKKIKGNRIIPTRLNQNTTTSINLAVHLGDLVIFSTPAAGITLSFSNQLPSGRKLIIINLTSTFNITTSGTTGAYIISPEEITFFISDGTNMNPSKSEGSPINPGKSGIASHAEGKDNNASGDQSHAEGLDNVASAIQSHAEGADNNVSGNRGHAEGSDNTVNGEAAHAEGRNNTAAAGSSHAQGEYSHARLSGQFAQANGRFAALGDIQFARFIMRGLTTNNTLTELTTPVRFTVEDETAYACTITIHGRRDTGADHAMYKRMVIIERTGGTVAFAGAVQTIGSDIETSAAYNISLTADDTNKSLNVSVQGAIGHNVRWNAVIETVEIKYND